MVASTTESKRLGKQQWYVLAAALLGWMFDGLEMGLFPIAARPALQDLMGITDDAQVGPWISYLVALFLLGAATGGLLFGWLGDRMGRVRTMALSILTYSLFTGACYWATEPWHLGVYRFMASLGMGGEWALGVALVVECWPDRLRPILAGVIGAAANVGYLVIAVLAMNIEVTAESWRWTMLACATPALLAFFVIAFIPESERWKQSVSTGAAKPIREIFTTRLAWPTLLAIMLASVALIGTWGAVSGFLPPWADQLAGGSRTLAVTAMVPPSASHGLKAGDLKSVEKTSVSDSTARPSAPKTDDQTPMPVYDVRRTTELKEDETVKPGEVFRYRLIVTNKGKKVGALVRVSDRLPIEQIDASAVQFRLGDQINPGNVTFNPATGDMVWTIGDLECRNPFAKAWIQFVVSIGAILGCIVGPLLGNAVGRRPAYFGLCLLSLLMCGFLFRTSAAYDIQFILTTGVVGMVTASFYGWLPLYLPELFPTRVRATGQGLSFNFGRILAALGAVGTGQLLSAFDGSYARACGTITLVYVIGMVLIWLAPETKGKPLPD